MKCYKCLEELLEMSQEEWLGLKNEIAAGVYPAESEFLIEGTSVCYRHAAKHVTGDDEKEEPGPKIGFEPSESKVVVEKPDDDDDDGFIVNDKRNCTPEDRERCGIRMSRCKREKNGRCLRKNKDGTFKE